MDVPNDGNPLPVHLERVVLNEFTYPDKDDLSDITIPSPDRYHGNALSGFLTFAHLPGMQCFDPESFDEDYDIAIIGATYDTGVSYRPGARFAPLAMRAGGTKRLYQSTYSPYKPGFTLNDVKIVDCGDPPMSPIDNRIALDQLYRAQRAALKHSVTNELRSKTPRIVTIGGDHTITFPSLKAVYEKYGRVSVIHFDSHLDTIDPYHMNKNVTEYAALNHGTFLHWAHENGFLAKDQNVHAGLRGWYELDSDVQRDSKQGFARIMARDLDQLGVEGVVSLIKNRVGDNLVYISVDIDVLDPAFAPLTGTVEPGGWSSRELLSVIDGLLGLPVVGADVVEISPPYDSNDVTVEVGLEVVRSLLTLMASTDIAY